LTIGSRLAHPALRQVTAQAVALTSTGPAGSSWRQCSRSASRRSGGKCRHVCPGRADSESERFPPLLEGGRPNPDGQRGGLRAAEPRLRAELGQVTFADTGQVRLVHCGRVQLARRPPECGQRPAVAAVIPHAGGDHPAGPGNPAHLTQACDRISHEVNDQLCHRRVEAAIGERQLLGR